MKTKTQPTLEIEQDTQTQMRKLLEAPPAYLVNNSYSNSSVANSFPSSIAYVDSIGGAHNLTFGSGAYNKTCTLSNNIPITSIISLDLADMSPVGFTLNGGIGYYSISSSVTTPTGLTFVSSAGNGIFAFAHSIFQNLAAGSMLTNVNDEVTLFLSGVGIFRNNAAGNMTTNVNDQAILSLSGNSTRFSNQASGSMLTNVNDNATLALSGGSYLVNQASGSMLTNVNDNATLALSGGSYFRNDGAGSMITTIYSGGTLSMDTGAAFYGCSVVVQGNATLSSGVGGSTFAGSALSLMPNATHIALIGNRSHPVQLMTWSSKPTIASNATIEGVTLNVMSPQDLISLAGHNYTIMIAAAGSLISGQYGAMEFNGSNISLPYTISYAPNSSYITSINLIFPAATPSPTPTPTLEPSEVPTDNPSLSPSLLPTVEPSLAPTEAPSLESSQSPTKVPTMPTWEPSIAPTLKSLTHVPSSAPSFIPSEVPSLLPAYAPSLSPTIESSFEPSVLQTLPTSIPSAIASAVASLIPTAAEMINNITNGSLLPTNSPSFLSTNGTMPFSTPFSTCQAPKI